MALRSDLNKRIKTYYEDIPKTKLMRRVPVIIRIDGKAFHTLTKGFKRPFDSVLMKTMQDTTRYLCENIQGCVLGYCQSDEISLALVDYQKLSSCAWFDNEIQKMCSISASMATMTFNKAFAGNIEEYINKVYYTEDEELISENQKYIDILRKAESKGAMFDARCFNIPKEEVTNYFYSRQLDATRNSIQMVGQANFSQKKLNKKSCNDIQDMLMVQKGINWNDFSVCEKRGTCVIKERYYVDCNGNEVENDFVTDINEPVEDLSIRNRWIIDEAIPIFKGEGRDYIEKLIMVGD